MFRTGNSNQESVNKKPFGKLSSSMVPLSHHEVSDFGVEDRTGQLKKTAAIPLS